MFKEISDILTHNIDEITRRWVEGLRQSQRTEVQKHMLTAEIVDGIKAILANLAQAIETREAPDHETLPLFLISGTDSTSLPASETRKPRVTQPLGGPFAWAQQSAASQGKQRHAQDYELHEVVIEWLMLRQMSTLLLVGILMGVAAAVAASRLIANLLYQVGPHDPIAMIVAVTVLLAAALIAGGIPALRAANVNPALAFKAD